MTIIFDIKVKVIAIKHYQFKNILIKKPYLKNIISNIKKSDTGKIQLTIGFSYISFVDNDEVRVMHSESNNIQIMINDEGVKFIKKLFKQLKNRYQKNLESMKVSLSSIMFIYFLINVIKQI